MITVKQESKLLEKIKSMTELEFVTFFEELSEHITKNQWHHIVTERFFKDEISYEEQELHDKIEQLENDALTYVAALSTIHDECGDNEEETDVDTLKKFLQRVKELSA